MTGYRISYSGGSDRGSADVGGSAIEHTITIPQPQSPLNYSISIITLSSSFPSSMAGPIMVTVGKHTPLNLYALCSDRKKPSNCDSIPFLPSSHVFLTPWHLKTLCERHGYSV